MTIPFGSGDLGSIVGGNSFRYDLTWEDIKWAARMLVGEEGPTSTQVKYSAVLWCMTSRLVKVRAAYRTYKDLILAYSEPINPRRRTTARREEIANLEWEQIPERIQDIVVRWAKGLVNNPVPRAVHFAQPGTSSRHRGRQGLQERGLIFLWDSLGRTADCIEDRGNTFYSSEGSQNWSENYVRILFNQNITQDSSPEQINSTDPEIRNVSVNSQAQPENNIFERNSTITINRTSPSNTKYQYFIVGSGSTADTQTDLILSDAEREVLILTNYERFYNQFNAMKEASTLSYTQGVAVLEVKTEDENGNIVSLNELIFSRSPFHNYFPVFPGEIVEPEFPDRPLASIESFSVKTEPPSVGGPVGISIARLQLKIHNTSIVRRSHPIGKYIAYLMIPGIFVRIKYGYISSFDEQIAFQWKEEDFFVAQHEVSINEMKEGNLTITLIPASQKLFNQIHIGESIPFSDLAANHQTLTDEDVNNVLQNIVETGTTEQQLSEMRRRLAAFKNQFNSGQPSIGYRVVRRADATLGSVLQGAISNSRLLENPEGLQAVPVENMVDALRSIQSILLTRRIQTILEQDAYRTVIKGVQRNVINIGPLVYNLILPEMESVSMYISQNNLKLGAEYSTEARDDDGSAPRRNNVKLIFDVFNDRAGQWATRPISVFPIDVDAIFAFLRQERDVGQFSSTINAFITRLNEIINEPVNFDVVRQPSSAQAQSAMTGQNDPYPLEIPQVKYLFYPDPTDETSWILLFYDAKTPIVRFRTLIDRLAATTTRGPIPRDELLEKLQDLKIPFVEMGEQGSFVKTLQANTISDDLLLTHNMILANQQSFGVRTVDGSPQVPAGISRDFLPGTQGNAQQVIRATSYIIPVEVTMTTECIVSAFLFTPIYIFFPIKAYESVYMPYVVETEIKNGSAQTRFVLNIQLTSANRITE